MDSSGDERWEMRRVDNPLDLEPTAWEVLTKGRKMGYYSAFHTRGKLIAWGLLGAVALFMGGIALIILFL
jgi:hypothetical protein